MSDVSITSSKPVRLVFPSHNCRRRVITLDRLLFADDLYTQSEIGRMKGDFLRLTEDEAIRLLNKISNLEKKFRSKVKSKGQSQVESSRLSQREVVEFAMNEVFAGVSVVQKKK